MIREMTAATVEPVGFWEVTKEPDHESWPTGTFSGSATSYWGLGFLFEDHEIVNGILVQAPDQAKYWVITGNDPISEQKMILPAIDLFPVGISSGRRQWGQSISIAHRGSLVLSNDQVNSTSPQERLGTSLETIEELFETARDQIFEDGMESEFSRRLVSYIKRYGNAAMNAITRLIVTEHTNAEVAAEVLRWIGHIQHTQTYSRRRWLLEKALSSAAARVRDGALIGLASLDDPHSMPYLAKAIRRERIDELRLDMVDVFAQLEKTRNATSPQKHTEG